MGHNGLLWQVIRSRLPQNALMVGWCQRQRSLPGTPLPLNACRDQEALDLTPPLPVCLQTSFVHHGAIMSFSSYAAGWTGRRRGVVVPDQQLQIQLYAGGIQRSQRQGDTQGYYLPVLRLRLM